MPITLNCTVFGVRAARRLFWTGWIQTAVLAVSISHPTYAQIPAPSDTAKTDSRFLSELIQRELYDLASDYARTRLRRSSEEEARAFWINHQSVVNRSRCWEESAADRWALTEESIESITEFLQNHVVVPETNLALQLNQIEALLNLARINQWLHKAGYRGPPGEYQHAQPRNVLPFVDRARELAKQLLKQLQSGRSMMNRRRMNTLRERTKCLEAELSVMRYLTLGADTTHQRTSLEQANELRTRLQLLERAARLPSTRQTAQRLLAELQLDGRDFSGLELNLRHKKTLLTDSQRLIFNIRSLLQQGKATSALQQCNDSIHETENNGSELRVLRLESLFVMRLLADGLQDKSLVKHTDEDVANCADAVLSWQPSVWRDGALRVLQRYQLVVNVGAEAAAIVEKVEILRSSGQHDRAYHELQRALRLLPPDASAQSRAAIRLRLGEICISRQNWEQALPLLHRAEQLFTAAGRSAGASTAALLRVFTVGQQWKHAPEDNTLQQKYFEGLIEHRKQWPNEATYQQSTEWLVKLTQQIDPLYAAEILAEEAAEQTPFPEQLRRMIKLGEQLERTRQSAGQSRSTKTWFELVSALQANCAIHQLTIGPLKDQSARLLILEASLSTDAKTKPEIWERLHQRFGAAAAAVTDIDSITQNRLNLIRLVAAARTSTDSSIRQQRRQEYLLRTTGNPLQAAARLALYLDGDHLIQPGDTLIAATVEQLLRNRISQKASPTELSQMLELAIRLYRVTGDESIWNDLLVPILKTDLTGARAVRIAEMLMESAGRKPNREIVAPSAFWKRIQMQSKEGTSLWFESSLQLAKTQAREGRPEQARRQIRVTSVVYPEWGSEQRRRRVKDFLDNL